MTGERFPGLRPGMTAFTKSKSAVIPALEAGTSIKAWRQILIKVPGSSPGNDSCFVVLSVVIPGLEPGTSVRTA